MKAQQDKAKDIDSKYFSQNSFKMSTLLLGAIDGIGSTTWCCAFQKAHVNVLCKLSESVMITMQLEAIYCCGSRGGMLPVTCQCSQNACLLFLSINSFVSPVTNDNTYM